MSFNKLPEVKSFLLISLLIITLFLIFGDLNLTESLLHGNKDNPLLILLICILLLVLDLVLPLPSSIIMVLTGSLLGPWLGFLANFIGINLSNLIGYGLGHLWPRHSFIKKLKRNLIVDRNMIIIGSRGIPVLAEAISITAGYTRYPFIRYFYSILIGNLPYCIVYSLAGYIAFENFEWLLALGFNLLLILSIYLFQKQKIDEVRLR